MSLPTLGTWIPRVVARGQQPSQSSGYGFGTLALEPRCCPKVSKYSNMNYLLKTTLETPNRARLNTAHVKYLGL